MKRFRLDLAPLVFITSNDEKELSEAFLRRCLFTFIPFPDRERLEQIVQSHFGAAPEAIVKQAVKRSSAASEAGR